eukprot:6450373-Pyramimonas_sp.AAC.1
MLLDYIRAGLRNVQNSSFRKTPRIQRPSSDSNPMKRSPKSSERSGYGAPWVLQEAEVGVNLPEARTEQEELNRQPRGPDDGIEVLSGRQHESESEALARLLVILKLAC